MTQYSVRKKDLHQLLRMLQVLGSEEELLLVNNMELRDPGQEFVTVLVDREKSTTAFTRPPAELTDRELETLELQLSAFEHFLLRELRQVHQRLGDARAERVKRRQGEAGSDGVPPEVEDRLLNNLRSLLDG